MATKFEDWSEHTTGAGIPTGYSAITGSATGTMSVINDAPSPGGKSLQISGISGGNNRFIIAPNDIASSSEQQSFVLVSLNTKGANNQFFACILRGHETNHTFYHAAPMVIVGGTDERVRVNRMFEGAFQNVGDLTGQSLAAGTVYAVLGEAVGTTIRVKVWVPADVTDPRADEPGTWTVSGTNSDITSGRVAIGCREGGSNTYRVLVAGFGTDGDPAPMSASEVSGGLATPSNFTFAKVDQERRILAAADAVPEASSYELEWQESDGAGGWIPVGVETSNDPDFELLGADGVQWEGTYRGRKRAMP